MPKKILLTDSQKIKKAKGICITNFCMKKNQPGRSKCCSCAKKIVQKNNPLRYAYSVKKNNALRKFRESGGNKRYAFTLTFEYFKELAEQIDYMKKKGTSAKSMTIDRKQEEWGYHNWNVQGLTLRENIYKYKKYKYNNSSVPF